MTIRAILHYGAITRKCLGCNGQLIGLLLGHSQSGAQDGSARVNPVTGKYLLRNMRRERDSSRQVAEAIQQVAGMLPMDDGVIHHTTLRAPSS